jgi:hypothetical protein
MTLERLVFLAKRAHQRLLSSSLQNPPVTRQDRRALVAAIRRSEREVRFHENRLASTIRIEEAEQRRREEALDREDVAETDRRASA